MNAYLIVYTALAILIAGMLYVVGMPWTSGSGRRRWRRDH